MLSIKKIIQINTYKKLYFFILLKLFFNRNKYRYKPSPFGRIIIAFLPLVKTEWRNGQTIRCLNNNYYWVKCSRLGSHEPFLEKVISCILEEGETVIDAGAQIGVVSVICSKLVGETGKVIAFEPHPENYQTLLEALEVNSVTNVKPINAGLASKNGRLFFWEALVSGFTLLPDDKNLWPKEAKDVIEGSCVRVDDYIKENNIQNISLLKVDVDGSDLDVLIGSQELLKAENPPLVVFESSVYWLALGYKLNVALSLFRDLGYDLYASQIASDRVFVLHSGEELPGGWGEERGKAVNIYAIKNKRHKKKLNSILNHAESISKIRI